MSEPKTLREMAGAGTTPPDWADSALVLIDCQNEYIDGVLALPGVQPALAECTKLVALARSAGSPVVHIVHHGAPGGAVFDPAGHSGQEAEAVVAADGEAVIPKGLPNAFANTTLDETLKATGRTSLVLAGFMTHMCISSTARAALDLGYSSTVVDAACATRDLPDGKGGVLSADDLHRASIIAMSDRFALIVDDASAWG